MPKLVPRLLAFLAALTLTGCGVVGSQTSGQLTITITDFTSSIAVGGTEQFVATAKDGSGNAVTGISFTWSSSTPSVATVGAASGAAMALLPGTTQISASANGVTSNAVTLTVTPGFLSIATLNVARSNMTMTVLNSGKVLIAGGRNSAGITGTAELYDPATQTFTLIGSLNIARYDHAATLLDNGMVLITGGWNSAPVATAELYDPATGTFTITGNLITARLYHTATHLQNGMVLLAGGSNGTGTIWSSAELYDPTTGVFSPAGSLQVARRLATATPLNDGTILIAGGLDSTGTAIASAEIYDPETGTFTLTGNLNTARGLHTATLLNGGDVLIAGGSPSDASNEVPLASAELYNPATRTFSPTGNLNAPRTFASATLLNNGTVLIAGGEGPGSPNLVALTSAEVFDPVAGTFSSTGSLGVPRAARAAALLANGTVLLAGGYDLPSAKAPAELYEPATFMPPGLQSIAVSPGGMTVSPGAYQPFVATGTFASGLQQLQSVTWSTTNSAAVQISNDASNIGTSVVVGSPAVTIPITITAAAGNINGSAILNVRPTGFVNTASMHIPRETQTATLLKNGKVLIAAGAGSVAIGPGAPSTAELYDPSSGTFVLTGELNVWRYYHTATLLQNGTVLVAGGNDPNALSITSSAELYNPASGTFAITGNMITGRLYHTSTLLPNGTVLIAGGQNNSNQALASAELYNPATGTFAATGTMNVARVNPTATLLGDGTVLIAGGCTVNGVPYSSAEIYDPSAGTFTLTGNLNVARYYHTATLLPNGLVLLTGGFDVGHNPSSSAELYDPISRTFQLTGNLATGRDVHTATLLNDGFVLIAGGQGAGVSLASAELYNPATGLFTATPSLITSRFFQTATLLNSGMVLITGGYSSATSSTLTSSELY
jgi:large repetitive protein